MGNINQIFTSDYQAHLYSMLSSLDSILKDTDDQPSKQKVKEYLLSNSTESSTSFLKETVESINLSFENRKKQTLSDVEILNKINTNIDHFRSLHDTKTHSLISTLLHEVDIEINNYRTEISNRLSPYTIKERFKNKDDFELWLNTLNTSYKNILNNAIERKLHTALRTYLKDVEIFFEMASKYISERENYLSLEDQFYGSLSESKNSIVSITKNCINEMYVYNKSLYEASDDLFDKMWEARRKYDVARYTTTAVATGVGTTGLATATSLVAKSIIRAAVLSSAPAIVPLTVISVSLLSAWAISTYSMKLSSALFSKNLEKEVMQCLEEFNIEIDRAKLSIHTHLTDSVTQIFTQELDSLEKSFLDFRRTTYIDENNLQKIEPQLKTLQEGVYSL